jgi:hypothetical protein
MGGIIPETDEMFQLGEAVFLEGVWKLIEYKNDEDEFIHKRSKLIIKKRLAVVEFTNGLELILKAILIKKGYCVYTPKRDSLFKLEDKIKDSVDEDRTIDLSQVTKFFRETYRDLPFDGVEELRKLRNQIVHRGTRIDPKKRSYFIAAIDCLNGIYKLEGIKHRKFLKIITKAKLDF